MGNGNNPTEQGTPNMMNGMGGMFGGPRYRTYLLTPPVSVKEGENLVFSARKPSGDDNGFSFDMKAIMGMTDTIFVVERSVYGKNQWVRVGDYTTTLTGDFQTCTISGTPKGEYRFRFISGDSLCIDSIAGGRINMNAPDLLVRLNGRSVQTVNYGIARGNQTKTFQLINTGTSDLQLYALSSDPTFYSLS